MKDFDAIHEAFKDETILADVESMVFAASAAAASSRAAAGEKYLETFGFILFMKILNFQPKRQKKAKRIPIAMTFSRHYTYAYKYI
jgi:hypothetical protein